MPTKIFSALILSVFFSIPNSQAVEGYSPISVMQLVVTPEKFVNQRVRVKGYFETGIFSIIYLNHLSAEIGDTESGVEVIDKTDEGDLALSCNKKYVVLSGRFIEQQKHYEITDVMEALDAKTLKPCWTKDDK